MKRNSRNKVILVIAIILLIPICFAGYLLNRWIQLNNNELLMTYETLKPVSVMDEKVGNSIYTNYYFGENIGRVIVEKGGLEIAIRDDKRGFLKGYRYGVLYYTNDMRKEELFAGIKSYLNLGFLIGRGRKVSLNDTKNIRTVEECQRIGQLLKEKKYDQITEDKRNKVILTNKGTYFVN